MLNIQQHVPLAPLSTFRIGGPADYFISVETIKDLVEALEYAESHQLKTFVFSGGSNLLIADAGFRGMVIKIDNRTIRVSGTKILVDAGASLLDVVRLACDHGLAGLERLAGIPGSVGGAIRGNAGAFGMEIGNVVSSVKYYDRANQVLREFGQSECRFSYRSSRFKADSSLVILSAVLVLTPGDKESLLATALETIEKREANHPQDASCAGSFFMNPVVPDEKLRREFETDTGVPVRGSTLPAGWLIDHVGLRGKKVGGAEISLRHPNYFVNTGKATAEEVLMLASIAKQRVRSELGVQLKEEVQFVGF